MEGAIRTGVVGLGYFGSFHARHYAAHPGARLVAVVDADPGRSAAASALHGAEPLADHRALIGAVDAVSVTVPTALHHDVARDLIDAGIHVLVEKPITQDPASARDLIARAEKAGVLLEVGHIERFSSTFEALRAAVREPLVIDCVRANPWSGRAADVDVVVDLMIHDIDLVLTLAGSPVKRVEAAGASIVSPHIDVAEARLEFENGIAATLRASRVAPSVDRQIRVYEKDRIAVADLANRRLGRSLIDPNQSGPGRLAFETVEIAPRDALGAEIAAFLAGVSSGRPQGVGGQAGLEALVVADQVRSAIRASGDRRRPFLKEF